MTHEEGIKRLSLEVLTKASGIREDIAYFATLETWEQKAEEAPVLTALDEITRNLSLVIAELGCIEENWSRIKDKIIGQSRFSLEIGCELQKL